MRTLENRLERLERAADIYEPELIRTYVIGDTTEILWLKGGLVVRRAIIPTAGADIHPDSLLGQLA